MKRLLKLLVSLLVTVLFTWLAFRDSDWKSQLESLKSAQYIWLLPYFVLLLAIHVARTLRWGFLLAGMEKIPFRKLNEASAIGFMMLLILPFRLGEFARPFLIAQRSNVRRSAAMTTVVLERIVDGLTIATLLRVLLFFIPDETPQLDLVKLGSNVMFAVFGGGLAFLLFALWHQQTAVRWVQSFVGRFSPPTAEKCADVVNRFVGALRQMPSGPQFAGFILFTGVYWGLNGLGMAMLANAFPPMSLSPFQGFVVLTVLVVGLMIPAAPGMMGTFQAATKLGLSLFLPASVVNTSGLAYANVMWLCQTAQQIGMGLLVLSISQLSFKDIAGKLDNEGEGVVPNSPSA